MASIRHRLPIACHYGTFTNQQLIANDGHYKTVLRLKQERVSNRDLKQTNLCLSQDSLIVGSNRQRTTLS